MKSALATAFVAFVTAVSLLTHHYKTEWPAPNFVTHSSTFDWLYQAISTDSSVKYSYSHVHDPSPIVSSNLLDLSADDQQTQEKQSSLYHLLHIPPWALVPDRITSHQGTVSHLYDAFDTISQRWKDTLSAASDSIDTTPTKSLMRSHTESLSKASNFWMKNISAELFNASQLIFSYQMLNYADEIEQWVQNSPHTDSHLRFLFERTRGWPLLYNIFDILDKNGQTGPNGRNIRHQVWQAQLEQLKQKSGEEANSNYAGTIDCNYYDLCRNIMDSIESAADEEQQESEDSDKASEKAPMTLKECEVMLDLLLPWLPDRGQTLSAMWPGYENILGNMESLKGIEGVNSSFTQVIKQSHRPSSDVPLHYVSADGSERIRVEWFINDLHYRATNLAFVRRIRLHVKRMTSALRISIGKEDPPEADDWEAYFAQYDPDAQPTVDPLTQQLDTDFVDFLDFFCNETEKGQFDKVLQSDLSQDMSIFFHALPSVRVFRDDGIKKAWNLIVGVWDKTLIKSVESVDITDSGLFVKFAKKLLANSPVLKLDLANYETAKKVTLEIVPVWPYTVGGWLRAQTPELPFYSYPDGPDSQKYGMKRCVLLLDVLVQVYVNNMRGVGDNKFLKREYAKLVTLQSLMQYLNSLLTIEHSYFYNPQGVMFPLDNEANPVQGVLARLGALIACNDVNGGAADGVDRDTRACMLSGVMFNVIDGFVRENENAQYFVLFLERMGIFKRVLKDADGNELKVAKIDFDFDKLLDENVWKQWKEQLFSTEGVLEQELGEVIKEYYEWKYGNIGKYVKGTEGKKKLKRKKEDRSVMDELFALVRNIAKYSIVTRPGEDSYLLDK